MPFELQPFSEKDIDTIVVSFAHADWPKPRSTFEVYLEEQQNAKRVVWVAYSDQQFAGYVTLKWESQYKPFRKNNIPEIMDLNVLPAFRCVGIGTALLLAAETEAYTKHDVVGLGVGLYPDYGAAQRLYVKRGYTPDGLGLTYHYKPLNAGDSIILDDDLVLWFMRRNIRNDR